MTNLLTIIDEGRAETAPFTREKEPTVTLLYGSGKTNVLVNNVVLNLPRGGDPSNVQFRVSGSYNNSPSTAQPYIESSEDAPASSTEGLIAEAKCYREQLQGLARLQDGWDGYRARAIPGHALNRSYRLLRFLTSKAGEHTGLIRLPDIVPTGQGSVQLEWEDLLSSLLVEIPAEHEPISIYGHLGSHDVSADSASPEEVWEAVKILCSR